MGTIIILIVFFSSNLDKILITRIMFLRLDAQLCMYVDQAVKLLPPPTSPISYVQCWNHRIRYSTSLWLASILLFLPPQKPPKESIFLSDLLSFFLSVSPLFSLLFLAAAKKPWFLVTTERTILGKKREKEKRKKSCSKKSAAWSFHSLTTVNASPRSLYKANIRNTEEGGGARKEEEGRKRKIFLTLEMMSGSCGSR